VPRVVQQVPVQSAVVVPFAKLGELAAHEQQLLARMRVHVPVAGAQRGEALPVVAGHLAEQRALAVHHLVVAQRQDVALAEGVDGGEGELAVMVRAVFRRPAQVAQRVVHPAHVPLVPEAQAVLAGRPGHAGPGRGLLRDRHRTVAARRHRLVGPPKKIERFQVLVAAVDVRHPLPGTAAVVQVEHRGHGVHAQPVGVIGLQPEQGVGDQDVAHRRPAEVVDQGVPVGMIAAAPVRVLVQRRAVEAGQAVRVAREVRRHPVQDDAEPGAVRGVDEGGEVRGRPEAAGRREQADGLVAPGAVEGMLADRQQLQVGEAHRPDVGNQPFRQFRIAQIAALGRAQPGAQVALVDGHRRVGCLARGAGRHPVAVVPGGVRRAMHPRGRGRRLLPMKGHWVRLQRQHLAVRRLDFVLVERPGFQARHKQLPEAGLVALAHDVAPAVPAVEVANDRNPPRVRRPDRESHARDGLDGGRMRAQTAPERRMRALGHLHGLPRIEQRREAIGVLDLAGGCRQRRGAAGRRRGPGP